VQRQRAAWQYFLNYTLDGPQIRGTITDMATGLPLSANVAVQEVTFTHGEAPRHADTKGKYHWLARSNQTYHLNFTKTGYCPATGTATVGTGPSTLDVAMIRPTPPGSVSASGAGDNQIDVSWSPALNATEYKVFRSLTAGGPYTQVGTVTAPATIFHDNTVSGSTTYYYVVKSLQPCESVYSTETSAITTGVCFVGPAFAGLSSVTNTEATTCTVELAWAAAGPRCNPQVTYRAHRSTAPSFTPDAGNLIASGLTGTTFTDVAALVDGTAYYYLVRAVDGGNGMDDGNTVILSTIPTGPVATGTWTDDAGDTGAAKLVVSSPWSVQATGGKTAPHVYATGTYTNNLCAALTTPAISVLSVAALGFASKYDIETNWDAGIVEVAQGPAFSTWSRLTTVNYPDALLNPGTACSFPRTFTGTVFSKINATPAYPGTDYTGSLAAYAGKDIKLRFKLGSDSTGTGQGWWVDDIAVTNAVFKDVCSSGTGANPKEVSPTGAPMTASRAAAGTGVDFVYTPACGAVDNAVFWGVGPIVGSPVWTNSVCAVGNTGTSSFDPGDPAPGSFFYFVIVGQNAAKEGSYGQRFDGLVSTERPEAVGVGACDRPQDLTGDCP
jgi:hypothetical protein